MGTGTSGFPRSIDRGPIEASGVMPASLMARYFRDQLIAAPLKLEKLFQKIRLGGNFRDQLIAAPLKQAY